MPRLSINVKIFIDFFIDVLLTGTSIKGIFTISNSGKKGFMHDKKGRSPATASRRRRGEDEGRAAATIPGKVMAYGPAIGANIPGSLMAGRSVYSR